MARQLASLHSRTSRTHAPRTRRSRIASQRVSLSNPTQLGMPYRPYSSLGVRVTAGPLLFVSGQVAWDKNYKVVGIGDVRKQTVQVLKNIKVVLKDNGATLDDIVKMTVFVTNMAYFEDVAQVRNQYFPNQGTASTMVEVSHLALPELLIEMDAIAVCS